MKKAIAITALLVMLTGCNFDSGPTLTSREKYICGQCHKPPFPEQHSAAEWPNVITRMLEHIQANNRMMPDSKEQEEILKYYQIRSGQ